MGEDPALKKLLESARAGEPRTRSPKHVPPLSPTDDATDRQGAHVLAEFHGPQMQATRDQDNTIPHQDETHKTAARVGAFHLGMLTTLADDARRPLGPGSSA